MTPSCGQWCETTIDAFFNGFQCPLWRKNAAEPNQEARFACDLHVKNHTIRLFQRDRAPATGCRAARAVADVLKPAIGIQQAKAMMCRILREAPTAQLLVDRSSPFLQVANPRSRPHRDRSQPYCLRATTSGERATATDIGARVCFAPGWPTPTAAAEHLLSHGLVASGDAVILSGLVAATQNESLAHMLEYAQRLQAPPATNASLASARARGMRVAWREKLPQGFSNDPTGAYVHASYGSPGQNCARQQIRARSAAQAAGLEAIEAAGGRTVRVWDEAIAHGTGGYLQRWTPYLHGKLDCTHYCEPSGALEMVTDATLAALAQT